MGLLVDGVWHDRWYDTARSDGRFVRSDGMSRIAVAMMRPAATAPIPRSAPATAGMREYSAYAAVRPMTMKSGTRSRPPSATRPRTCPMPPPMRR